MANVRKLMRMAREYEADEGRDLRGFIDFVAERDAARRRARARRRSRPRTLDAVRLMTIHRAKGLEFPVVCVATSGKVGREDDARAAGHRRRARRPAAGVAGRRRRERRRARADQGEQQKVEDEEEERRIFYVAATRAREHLVLSGATDLEKRQPPRPAQEPMRWLARLPWPRRELARS